MARIAAIALALCAAGATGAWAQNGTVSGQVTEEGSGRPLAGAQVSLANTGLGALTQETGRFAIVNVPPGSYTVRVERIGFRVSTQTVQVTAGQTTTVNFALPTEALGLDEIVVTGTAGAARKREVGNSIAQIQLANVTEPPVNVDALLQARIPGMTVLQSSAQVGSGAMIRLRGNVSVGMSNQPILYVDGVRVRSEGFARNVPFSGSGLRSNNDVASPLNDINPADIDRIEVIKGAAATTLYGTEAAAGVIQIFTKRGAAGKAIWTAQVDQGFSHVLKFGVDPSTKPPSEDGIKAFCDENGANCGTADYLYINPWLRDAYRQKYSLSVGGGGQALQYFISGAIDDNEGVLPNDHEQKYVVRGNFTFSPLSLLSLQWNTSFTSSDLVNTPGGNNAQGITLNVYRRDRNYLQSQTRDAIDPLLDWQIGNQTEHLITGFAGTFTPFERFTNRVSVGYDLSSVDLRNLRPFGFIQAPRGIISDRRYQYSNLTFDYVGSYEQPISDAVRTTLSWGAQSITTVTNETSAYGQDFAGPGDPVVTSAGLTLGKEEREKVVNAGFFVQDVLDLKNRYFVTAGLRVDGNSAFGSNLGLQAYPKVSLSYIISDEDFWPASFGQLKLRSAWGQSGRAPGAFDAGRTYSAAGWGTQPALLPLNVGNPDLGPERTSELEFGFEGAFFQNRVSTDFTWYHQKTTDALFNVRQVPSLGFLGSQLENIGALENKGIEFSLNASLLRSENFGFDVGGSLATNFSKVTDLGGAPPFSLGNYGWVVEGQPAPVIRGACVGNPDEHAAPEVVLDCNYGPNLPTHTWGMNTTVTLPKGISVTARGEYQKGAFMEDGAAWNAVTRSVRWPGCFEAYTIQETQGLEGLTAKQRSQCVQAEARNDFFIYPADFFKVREITLQLPVPARFVPGSSRASLTFSGRNVWKWVNKDFPVFEPEMAANDGFDTQVRSMLEQVPPPATYTASLRVVF